MRAVLLALSLALSLPSPAQSGRTLGVGPARNTGEPAMQAAAQRRVALVIGNDNYKSVGKLGRAGADAAAIGRELGRLGFDVLAYSNLDRKGMRSALDSLFKRVAPGDVALIFYAGHGVQISGSNYLLPTDIDLTSPDELVEQGVDLGDLIRRLGEAKVGFSLLVVDACRDNPFTARSASFIAPKGLAMPAAQQAPDGLVVLYSAGINEQALDRLGESDHDPNGLFTREFLKELRNPVRRIDEMLRKVRTSVRDQARKVGHAQNPALYDQSNGDFYFAAPQGGAPEMTALGVAEAGKPPKRVGLFMFANDGQAGVNVRQVVLRDLSRLPQVKVELVAEPSTSNYSRFEFAKWAPRLDYAVIGEVLAEPDGRFDVRFRTLEVEGRSQVRGQSLVAQPAQLSLVAHRIADQVASALVGGTAPFSTRIAYLLQRGPRYEIRVSDYDGAAAQVAVASKAPFRSLKWAPDGKRLAYVSFERGAPAVFVQDLSSGRRSMLAEAVSSNARLDWNPAGDRLIVGDADQVYSIPATGGARQALAPTGAAVEDLAVAADGSVIVATRDRAGSLLQALNPATGVREDIKVSEGSVTNVSAVRGEAKLALVIAGRGRDRVALLDRRSGKSTPVLDAPMLKSVSVAPGAGLVAAVAEEEGRSYLVQAAPGGPVQRIEVPDAQLLEVAWSPFLQ